MRHAGGGCPPGLGGIWTRYCPREDRSSPVNNRQKQANGCGRRDNYNRTGVFLVAFSVKIAFSVRTGSFPFISIPHMAGHEIHIGYYKILNGLSSGVQPE